jgi:NADPH2:quinone reductase
MRVLELVATDGPAGLRSGVRPDPSEPDAVVIDVVAAGVSFPDLLMTHGRYQQRPELPAVPGLEISGKVRSAPPNSGFSPGDRVCASLDNGGFAEVAAAPVQRVFPLPVELTFEEGAALPVNYLTAIFALVRRGGLLAGETVLVLGAAGGLGTALCGVAAALGARAIGVVSDAGKTATARTAGAESVIVGTDWRSEVLEQTEGRGANLVADVIGGDATLQAVRSTAPEGRVLVLGFAGGEIPAVSANRLLLRNVALVGAGLGALAQHEADLVVQIAKPLPGLVRAGLRPVIDRVLPLADGADGLRLLEDRAVRGKVVLWTG